MFKSRRVALLLGTLIVGALAGWLVKGALVPQWGGAATETFWVRRARAGEWKLASESENARWAKLTRQNAPGWYATFAEPVQTFGRYQNQNARRPTSARRVLVLLPLGTFSAQERQQLERLRQFCAAFFALPARLETPLPLEKLNVNSRAGAKGRQFDANQILSALRPRLPDDAAAYLAVTNRDLWSGDLNFVFGLASTQNRVGVYSLARYATKGAAPSLQLRRACQVLGHETGHMFGITHCVFYRCAMNGSNSLADADGAPLDFCPACARKLQWNIGYDSAPRASELNAFYQRHFSPEQVNANRDLR